MWRVASQYTLSAEAADILYGITPRHPHQEVAVIEGWTRQLFQLWVDDALLEERPNPYGFIPFIIFPNLREPKTFSGTSDIPILKEPSRELNRAISQLSTILELSGNPIAVLEGVEEAPGTSPSSPEQCGSFPRRHGPIYWTCSRGAA